MTYDTQFYGSVWLHSSKQHFLLYHTLHVCNNVSLLLDQLLTFTLFFIVLVILWQHVFFRTYHFPLSGGLQCNSSRRHMFPPYVCDGDNSGNCVIDGHFPRVFVVCDHESVNGIWEYVHTHSL